LVECLSKSAYGAFLSRSWYQIQDIARFFLNIWTSEQLNPFNHKGSDVWKHISIITECMNQSLRVIKEQDFFKSTQLYSEVKDKTKTVKFDV